VGAVGCLLYSIGSMTGASAIPSGSITLVDARKIISIVTNDSSAMFTFTNLLQFIPNVSHSTMSEDRHCENVRLADGWKTFGIQCIGFDG
jgi:hypothetical protein